MKKSCLRAAFFVLGKLIFHKQKSPEVSKFKAFERVYYTLARNNRELQRFSRFLWGLLEDWFHIWFVSLLAYHTGTQNDTLPDTQTDTIPILEKNLYPYANKKGGIMHQKNSNHGSGIGCNVAYWFCNWRVQYFCTINGNLTSCWSSIRTVAVSTFRRHTFRKHPRCAAAIPRKAIHGIMPVSNPSIP